MSKMNNDKIEVTAEEFRALAARIADEKTAPESKPAEPDERERLKIERERLALERERLRTEREREQARNVANADESDSRRAFVVRLVYGALFAVFLIWSIIITSRYF